MIGAMGLGTDDIYFGNAISWRPATATGTGNRKPTAEELAFWEESGGGQKTKFYRGVGCNMCSGTGFSDRIGVYELLRITPELRRYAGLTKECVVIGAFTRAEIWDAEAWQRYQEQHEDTYAKAQEEVLPGLI